MHALLIMLKHEQADRRRQVRRLPALVNFAQQTVTGSLTRCRDFLQNAPELALYTDAGLVPADPDTSLRNGPHGSTHSWPVLIVKLTRHRGKVWLAARARGWPSHYLCSGTLSRSFRYTGGRR